MITKKDGSHVEDPTLIGNYNISFADIMKIIKDEESNNEDSNNEKSRSISKLLINMDILHPKTSVGDVAALTLMKKHHINFKPLQHYHAEQGKA